MDDPETVPLTNIYGHTFLLDGEGRVDLSLSAPFPYFGGKRRAAPIIWQALGDPSGYVEPFAGSAAVLLARPPFKGRRTETLNDADKRGIRGGPFSSIPTPSRYMPMGR